MPAMMTSKLPEDTLEGRIAKLAPHFTLAVPPGPGPHPAIIQLHGCGGRQSLQDSWAAAFQAAGFAALVVDSLAHRGISAVQAYATVCTGWTLQGDERAGDLYAAYAWARRQSFIDPQRIAAIGWSHGGWTLLDGITLRPEEMRRATALEGLAAEPLAGLKGAILVYPYLGILARASRAPFRLPAPPVLALLAGDDTVVGWRAPQRALERQRKYGTDVEIEVFEGATHAFDEAQARDLRVRYDAALTARAQTRAINWLRARV